MKLLVESGGKASGTKFWFTVCSAICLVRFALADMTIIGIEFGSFDSAGASMLLGVFATAYVARQNVKIGGSNGN